MVRRGILNEKGEVLIRIPEPPEQPTDEDASQIVYDNDWQSRHS
jgi:hypothetical protein